MNTDDHVLQFRIQLLGVEPPVWRQIQVPTWYSMWDLHVAIQDAMGWQDYHLHAFSFAREELKKVAFGIPDEDGSMEAEMGIRTEAGWYHAADTLFLEVGDTACYEYDFGDGWQHDVTFEGAVPVADGTLYPRCIAGEQPCPPEDCGGVGGYAQLLETLAQPDSEEAAELVGWLQSEVTRYPPFEIGRFDLSELRFDDPDLRWRGAFLEDEDSTLLLPPRKADRRPYSPPVLTPEEEALRDTFHLLRFFSGPYEREAVDAVIARRDEAVPTIVELLEDALHYPVDVAADDEYFGHIYALMLAGYLRVEEAHGVVAALAALPDDLPHRLFEDTITQDLPAVLLRTCGGDFSTIIGLATDHEADMWGRSAAIDAIKYAAALGDFRRDEALAFFSSVLDASVVDDDLFFPSHVASCMVDLFPEGYADQIQRAFEEGLIDPGYFAWNEVEVALELGLDHCLAEVREEWEGSSLDDIHASMERWTCFHEDDAFAPGGWQLPGAVGPARTASPKKKSRRKQAKASRKKNRKKGKKK